MPALTAQQARDLAAAPYTQEELDVLFGGVDLRIEQAAELRQFFVDVRIGQNEVDLLTQWVQAAGYTIELSPPEVEAGEPIRGVINGESLNVRIGWQGFEFRAVQDTVIAGDTVTFFIDTVGVPDGREIYWQNTGTAAVGAFFDTVNDGTAAAAGNLVTIPRITLIGSAIPGTTIQIAAYVEFDGAFQQVAISELVTIVAP